MPQLRRQTRPLLAIPRKRQGSIPRRRGRVHKRQMQAQPRPASMQMHPAHRRPQQEIIRARPGRAQLQRVTGPAPWQMPPPQRVRTPVLPVQATLPTAMVLPLPAAVPLPWVTSQARFLWVLQWAAKPLLRRSVPLPQAVTVRLLGWFRPQLVFSRLPAALMRARSAQMRQQPTRRQLRSARERSRLVKMPQLSVIPVRRLPHGQRLLEATPLPTTLRPLRPEVSQSQLAAPRRHLARPARPMPWLPRPLAFSQQRMGLGLSPLAGLNSMLMALQPLPPLHRV